MKKGEKLPSEVLKAGLVMLIVLCVGVVIGARIEMYVIKGRCKEVHAFHDFGEFYKCYPIERKQQSSAR